MSKIGRHFFDFKPPPQVVLRSFSSRLDSNEEAAAFQAFAPPTTTTTTTTTTTSSSSDAAPTSRQRAEVRWAQKRRKVQLEAAAAGIDTSGLWDRGSHVIRLLARQRYVQQAEFIIPQEGADNLRGSDRLDNPFVVGGTASASESEEPEDDGLEGFVALDASHGKAVGGTALRVAAELGADALNRACFYVVTGPLCDLLAQPFLHKYILGRDDGDSRRRHCFRALSRNSEVDHCNCVSISPRGILILLVDQATYERLGLCGVPAARSQRRRGAGRQHATSVRWFRIAIDLQSEAYAVGTSGYARLLWALNPLRIPPTTLYVSWDAPPTGPSEVTFPPSFNATAPSQRKLATSSYALEKVFIPDFRATTAADQSSVVRSNNSSELMFIDGSSDEEQEQSTMAGERGPSGGSGSATTSLVSGDGRPVEGGGSHWLPSATARLEHDWCGIVALRLQSVLQQKPGPSGPLPMSDVTEMAAYLQPVTWRTEMSRLTCFRWTGFISASLLATFFRRARAVLADNPSLPWVGMAVWGFADTTSTWQHPVPLPKKSRPPPQDKPNMSPQIAEHEKNDGRPQTEDAPSPPKRPKRPKRDRQQRPGAGGHAPTVSRDHSFHFGGENDFVVIVFQDGTYHAIGAIAAQDC
eukprot:INCI7664.3.p1 GENE.INCI7664.3~~INCI7664.3.p1  ORF type:complete len:675 (-),score=99.30 INCI7664.3:210-2126(-)